MNENEIKVHYKGFTAKFDTWLQKTSDRVKEVGSHSESYGRARTLKYS